MQSARSTFADDATLGQRASIRSEEKKFFFPFFSFLYCFRHACDYRHHDGVFYGEIDNVHYPGDESFPPFSNSSLMNQLKVASSTSTADLIVVSSIPRLVLIYVSELLPVTYQLWLQRSKKKQEEKHNAFIQNL